MLKISKYEINLEKYKKQEFRLDWMQENRFASILYFWIF